MEQRGTSVRIGAAVLAALLAVACGGGGTPVGPTTPTGSSADATKIVTLDAGNFDALVIASPRPSLVEFHSPT